MRTVVAWSDTPPERDGVRSVCYDIAHSPDGTQLVAGVGSRVLVYNASVGDLLHSLKGHKDAVYAVSYSKDGKRFASGGADKTVIIWTSKAEGLLKYSHGDSIQCLEYNPVSSQLASATATEFGLWSPEQKAVSKHKVSGKVLCMGWTNDGQYLALGQFDGCVSVRDKTGGEKVRITRDAPCWTLAWNPSRDETHDVVAVGCWDGTLSFYQLNGMQVGKDVALGYDPCSVSYFSNGEYVCVGGTDRKVTLMTKEGTPLTQVCEMDNWVWCARPRPGQNYVAVGCEDGSVSMHHLQFNTVHGLYQDRYAYRDLMTDVIIQHLITEQKVRIKCRDYVKKIAVYKDRLAVQLSDKVVIYELLKDEDSYEMHYRVSTKIQKSMDCNLLVVTSRHVILCLEKKLQLFSFEGLLEREWVLEAVIRYIKIVGGPEEREGILVGLKDGAILKIFIDNPFPMQLVKHTCGIRCLDLSYRRQKVAAVDENSSVVVYDLETKNLVFEDQNANSVSWNSEFEDMLCYSGGGQLSIKTGDFPVHRQKLQGFVVGFKGSKVFCLHQVHMQTIDVPQSISMMRYLRQKDFDSAYATACLGVTDGDWRALGHGALDAMQLEVARKSFIRVRDVRFIELISRIEKGLKRGEPEQLFRAEAYAYRGKFQEAAKAFAKAGRVEKAMEMFSDLRQFDEAKTWAEEYAASKGGDTGIVQEFVHRQAEWAEEVSDYDSAATMYLQAKKFDKAIAILGKVNNKERMVDVMRALGDGDIKALRACAGHFARWGDTTHAKEAYNKLGDHAGLMSLYIESAQWDDAFALLRRHPEYSDRVYLPYAGWLADHDRFDEARAAYQKAGKSELSTHMLEQLTHNAVMERRYQDAGYCYWLMSEEVAGSLSREPGAALLESDEINLERFHEFKDRAEIYYAYDFIYRAMDEPFRSSLPSTLLNIGQFLLAKFAMREEMPLGVSLAYVLNTLAKHGEAMGAYKLARFAYSKLQGLRMPVAWQTQVDLASVITRSKPYADAEDLLPLCFRCTATNPLVSGKGDVCISCGGRFVRSFVTFEHLPMVEFEVAEDITPKEARKLIRQVPESRVGSQENDWGGDQRMTFDDGEDDAMLNMNDPFSQQMAVANAPIVCTRDMLVKLPPNEVLIRPSGCSAVKPQYFRLMDPDLPVAVDEAGNFYEADEYELACLERGCTPFTRKTVNPDAEMATSVPATEPDTPPPAKKSGWGTARGVAMVRGVDFGGSGEKKYDPGATHAHERRSLVEK